MGTISAWDPERACKAVESNGGGCMVIDVRTPVEFDSMHASCAESVPLDTLNGAALDALVKRAEGKQLFVLCQSGNRARKAAEQLAAAGRTDAIVVEGGTVAWKAAGLPCVESARPVMSLERQVRIAAGGIAATGAALALAVHPWFAGVPLFVGCGLVFAGVTDTCAMGMLISKMPWNQR